MKITPIQDSFVAGEISPLMRARRETDGYRSGLAELTNMYPDSRGPVVSRKGSRFISQGAGDEGRLMVVPVDHGTFYVGLFSSLDLTFKFPAGNPTAVEYSQNSSFVEGGQHWSPSTDGHATSTVGFLQGQCNLHVDAAVNRFAAIEQVVTVPATGDYDIHMTSRLGQALQVNIGTAAGLDDVFSLLVTDADGKLTFTATQTTLYMSVILYSDNTQDKDASIQLLGITSLPATESSFATLYSGAETSDLHFVPSPSGRDVYVLHPLHPPYKISYDPETHAFSYDLVVFTAPPAQWQEDNYPATGDFFQGRLWLGGVDSDGQTFWASKSGLPEDFTQGVLDDDGLTFTLAKYGTIKWMMGFKTLLIGTSVAEHIVAAEGGVGDVITPSNVTVTQQSAYGSTNVQPLQVGDQIFYVSADSRKLRAIQYEWQSNNWLSRDLTFTSEHITRAGIKHMTWMQNPKNILACVLNDGTIAAMVYERGNNLYGWAKGTSQGAYIDVASAPLNGSDYAVGLTKYSEGLINFEIQLSESRNKFLDSWVERIPEPDGLTVTGLGHLDGFDCVVLVDGAQHPNRTPVAGSITLQYIGAQVTVGLRYTRRIETLPMDAGSQLGSGSAWKKRWNKLYVRLLASALPLINGTRPPVRTPSTPMGLSQPVATEDIQVTDLGWSITSPVVVEQDLPFDLTISAIMGELNQEIK